MVRKDLSLTGAILIVISQLFSSFQSSETITKEISKFREEFQQSILDRETYFVRKTELAQIFKKMDQMNTKLIRMSEQIKNMTPDLYSSQEDQDQTIFGCSYHFQKRGI